MSYSSTEALSAPSDKFFACMSLRKPEVKVLHFLDELAMNTTGDAGNWYIYLSDERKPERSRGTAKPGSDGFSVLVAPVRF